MNKRNLFSILSFLGLFFIIYSVMNISKDMTSGDEVIENYIEVPSGFKRQFSRVTTKRRYKDLPVATFLSPEGKRYNWQTVSGDYKLINFWASWCAPCVLELPSLEKLAKRYKGKGLDVIPISIDTRYSHEQIKRFLDNRGISDFAAYYDDSGEIQQAIRIAGLPTSYLLDPKGRITHIFEGDANWVSTPSIQFFDQVLGFGEKNE